MGVVTGDGICVATIRKWYEETGLFYDCESTLLGICTTDHLGWL